MTRHLLRAATTTAVALATALLVTSCIEFREQSLSFRYDQATDTFFIYQEYRGIFASDGDTLSDSERAQLRAVMQGAHTFFFGNWIVEWDVDELRELARTPATAGADPIEVAERELARVVGENVRVGNGPFHLDGAGRLCGVQRVTILRFSEVLAVHSACLRALALGSTDDEHLSAVERTFLRRLGDDRAALVMAGPAALEYHAPMTREEFDAALAASEGDDLEEVRSLRTFIEAVGGSINFTEAGLVARLGSLDTPTATLQHAVADDAFAPNVTDFVRESWGIATAFDLAADRAAFLTPAAPDAPAPTAPAERAGAAALVP